MRVGKITTAQLEDVPGGRRRAPGAAPATSSWSMELLKDTERLYYVAQQVKAIVYSVFGWEEGEYRIHFADRAAQEAIKIDLHPANLIVRGVKKLYKPERLYRLLSPEDRLIPCPQPAYGLHEVELERWEAEILPEGGRHPHRRRAHPPRPAPRARRVRLPVRDARAQGPRPDLIRAGDAAVPSRRGSPPALCRTDHGRLGGRSLADAGPSRLQPPRPTARPVDSRGRASARA